MIANSICHLAFPSSPTGGLRGTEIDRLEDKNWQILFGLLRFQSHSIKGENHGQIKNKSIEHFMSPSLTRCSVIVMFLLRPNLVNGVHWPQPDTVRELVCKLFAQIFRLESDNLNRKQMRDILAMITNYAQPLARVKLSACPIATSKFHHTTGTHESAYSASIGELDNDGRITPASVLLAREMSDILGEPSSKTTPTIVSAFRQPTKEDLDAAAAFAYDCAGAQVLGPQLEFVMHVLTEKTNAIAHLGCGVGKSGGWILPLVFKAMFSQKEMSIILISPHNALVSQHAQQARESFGGTSLTVHTLSSADCQHVTLKDLQANLVVVSVEGFSKLRTQHEQLLRQCPIKICFIDEVHNAVQELFRVETWSALQNLASLGWKLYLLTATTNTFLSKCLSNYIAKTEFNVIGHSGEGYRIPNVAIEVEQCREAGVLVTAVLTVKEYFADCGRKVKAHIVSPTIRQATELAGMFNDEGVKGVALTGETSNETRQQIMHSWRHDSSLRVLVSTLTDGIDSAMVEMVVILETAGSIFRLIQAIGRIRPPQQDGFQSKIIYLRTDFDPSTPKDTNTDCVTFQETFAPDENKDDAMKFYTTYFKQAGLSEILDSKECLRRSLMKAIGVESEECGMCSNCLKYNVQAAAKAASQKAIRVEEEIRNSVLESLESMTQACPACFDVSCNGVKCLAGNHCFKCLGERHGDAKQCLANKPSLGDPVKMCPYCLVIYGNDIPYSGISQHNSAGECPYKERVKLVLLHDTIGKNDNGETARLRIESCAKNNQLWFRHMHDNLEAIRDINLCQMAIDLGV